MSLASTIAKIEAKGAILSAHHDRVEADPRMIRLRAICAATRMPIISAHGVQGMEQMLEHLGSRQMHRHARAAALLRARRGQIDRYPATVRVNLRYAAKRRIEEKA